MNFFFKNFNSKREDRNEQIEEIYKSFIGIFDEYPNDERMIVPLFKTLESFFEKDIIQTSQITQKYKSILIEKIIKEIDGTKSILKVKIYNLFE